MYANCNIPILSSNFQRQTKSHPFRCTSIRWAAKYLKQLVESIGRSRRSRLLSNFIILQIVILVLLIADQNVLLERGSGIKGVAAIEALTFQ